MRATRRWSAVLLCLLCTTGFAQPAETSGAGANLSAGLTEQVRQMATDGVRTLSGPETLRVEVQVGQLDPRLRLAPCSQVQPYVPTGSALWGRTRIGLRCVQGEKAWNVFLPVTVKVMAPALVASGLLPAGHVLSQTDMTQGEVDLAENPSAAVKDISLVEGRTLARAMAPGQSLRQTHLKARQWFAAGEQVKVVALGMGFSVVSQGEAMTAGFEGQVARVKLESGRVLTGMPSGERQLELPL